MVFVEGKRAAPRNTSCANAIMYYVYAVVSVRVVMVLCGALKCMCINIYIHTFCLCEHKQRFAIRRPRLSIYVPSLSSLLCFELVSATKLLATLCEHVVIKVRRAQPICQYHVQNHKRGEIEKDAFIVCDRKRIGSLEKLH